MMIFGTKLQLLFEKNEIFPKKICRFKKKYYLCTRLTQMAG